MNELEKVREFLNNQIPVFQGVVPGSEGIRLEEKLTEEINGCKSKIIVSDTLVPTITPFMSPKQYRDGRPAIIVIPGGAFRRQVLNQEGLDVAEWLDSLGVAAFVLKHRYPVNDFPNSCDVTLIDAQRAVRYVRYNAAKWGIAPDKIGVMGFSAGGHLASAVSCCYDREVYQKKDEIDGVSARPDFCVMGYPATCLEMEEHAYILKNRLEGVPEYIKEILGKYSTDTLVSQKNPPTFIFETDDDKTTPAEHSVRYYLACRKAEVPAELHIFKSGGHGFGISEMGKQTEEWKRLFINWAKEIGVFS